LLHGITRAAISMKNTVRNKLHPGSCLDSVSYLSLQQLSQSYEITLEVQ